MNKALTRLQRVLDLEASQGYKNKAVVGGIRQFATFWVGQAREAAVSEMDKVLVEQVAEVLADYGRLPGTEARAKVIEQLQAKLQQRQAQEPAATPAQTAPPPPQPRPERRPEPQAVASTPPPPPKARPQAPPAPRRNPARPRQAQEAGQVGSPGRAANQRPRPRRPGPVGNGRPRHWPQAGRTI
jgi:ATP-dependent DNA helicase RecG